VTTHLLEVRTEVGGEDDSLLYVVEKSMQTLWMCVPIGWRNVGSARLDRAEHPGCLLLTYFETGFGLSEARRGMRQLATSCLVFAQPNLDLQGCGALGRPDGGHPKYS